VKNKLTDWVSSVNIYNHLAGLWVMQNTPFDGNVVSKESFLQSFDALSKNKDEKDFKDLPNAFYSIASTMWVALKDPSNDDIKNILLEIVAKTINKSLNLENESLAQGLYNMFKMLIEKKKELVSEEAFISLVRVYLGETAWKAKDSEFCNACRDFYTFAKRFVLVDFPHNPHTKDIVRLITSFIKDKGFLYSEQILDLVESQIDRSINYFKIECKALPDAVTLLKKAERIVYKIQLLATYLLKTANTRVKSSPLYIKADERFHVTEKVDLALHYALFGYEYATTKVVKPAIEYIKVNNDRIKGKLSIVFENVNLEVVKAHYNRLREKYQLLKKCTAVIYGDVLHLKFDKESLKEYSEAVKQEILYIYNELKTLEKQRILTLGNQLYQNALKKFNQIQTRALEAPQEGNRNGSGSSSTESSSPRITNPEENLDRE